MFAKNKTHRRSTVHPEHPAWRSVNAIHRVQPVTTPHPPKRLVNGEGDRLSGLVVDVFAGVLGVSSSAVWVEAFRPEIETALAQVFGPDSTEVIWRRSDGRLQQDGWKGSDKSAEATAAGEGGEARSAGGAAAAGAGRENHPGADSEEAGEGGRGKGEEKRLKSDAPTTVVRELGLEYLVRPQFGQKTGRCITRP